MKDKILTTSEFYQLVRRVDKIIETMQTSDDPSLIDELMIIQDRLDEGSKANNRAHLRLVPSRDDFP
jgi:hypothetical protein